MRRACCFRRFAIGKPRVGFSNTVIRPTSPKACGKLILLGEHAVVYGQPALGLGVGELTVDAMAGCAAGLAVRVPAWELFATNENPGALGTALQILQDRFPVSKGLELTVRTNLPIASGLGSSAALAVGCTRALAQISGQPFTDEEIRAIAHELEGVFHGSPSGLDDTLATYGGLCLFKRQGTGDLRHPSFGAQLTTQCKRIVAQRPPLLIGHSGTMHNTRELVLGLRARREAEPARYDALFAEIGALVWQGLDAMAAADWPALGRIVSANQALLDTLGVGAPALSHMIALANEAGAYGAKLTGAGGGGAVIALVSGESRKRLAAAWRAAGYRMFDELS